ncbi:MAG: signal peptidase II [Candidatus Hydrothermia bacterium]
MKKALIIFFSIFALDRITKYLVLSLVPYGKEVKVVGEVLKITHVHNPNSLWSLSLGQRFPYVAIGIGAIIFLVILVVDALRHGQRRYAYLYSLLMAGVAGNITDRIKFKEVIDFIDIGISPTLRWPVFNIADSAISIGLVIYFIMLIREKIAKRSNQ